MFGWGQHVAGFVIKRSTPSDVGLRKLVWSVHLVAGLSQL
jgi:hypothetical protein